MSKNEILLETGTNEMEILTVSIDGQFFGINVAKVQSIEQFDPQRVTALPQAPPELLGMLLYRDTTIPLIDLAAILEKEQPDGLEREISVITEFNNHVSSFKVHGVENISRISWEDFIPLNSMLGANAFVTGTVNLEGCEIPVLDLEHILAELFPNLVLETVTEETLQNRAAVDHGQLHIVFAEDSTTIRKGVVSVLKKVGFEKITEFENGLQAYDFIKNTENHENGNDPHAILALVTDIEMPRMDGLTLCRKLKQDERLRKIPIVIFSSLINDQMIEKCKTVGADHYVSKPEVNKLTRFLNQLSA